MVQLKDELSITQFALAEAERRMYNAEAANAYVREYVAECRTLGAGLRIEDIEAALDNLSFSRSLTTSGGLRVED